MKYCPIWLFYGKATGPYIVGDTAKVRFLAIHSGFLWVAASSREFFETIAAAQQHMLDISLARINPEKYVVSTETISCLNVVKKFACGLKGAELYFEYLRSQSLEM